MPVRLFGEKTGWPQEPSSAAAIECTCRPPSMAADPGAVGQLAAKPEDGLLGLFVEGIAS